MIGAHEGSRIFDSGKTEMYKFLKTIHDQNELLKNLTSTLKLLIESLIQKTIEYRDDIRAKKIQLEIIYSMITQLGHAKNFKEIFKIISTEIRKLVPVDSLMMILEFSPLKLRLLDGHHMTPITFTQYPFVKDFFEYQKPTLLNPPHPVFSMWTKKTYQSILVFPLPQKDQKTSRHALLNLASQKSHAFSKMDIQKLSDVISPIAIATEKMKLLEIIEEGSRQWKHTFDAISDLVTVIDKNFNLIKANQATEKISGQKVENVIGKKCYEVLAKRKTPCHNCPVKESFKTHHMVSEHYIKDFKNLEYVSFAYPLFNPKKKSDSFVVYYRDHTKASELYRTLIQESKMAAIGNLAGSLAHELNNPLTGISAFAQILGQEVGPKSPLYSDIMEIEKASFRCKNIIHNLLNFSEKKEPQKKDVSINHIIESTLPLIQYSSSGQQNISVQKTLLSSLPKISGDESQLQQVFLNLFLNAYQAMPKGGKLTIKTSTQKEAVQITISDTGIGISKQNISKIFDPFYTTKEKTRGTGLGLSVSYGIIRNHHGKIEVQSRFGKGTTFKILLPTGKRT